MQKERSMRAREKSAVTAAALIFVLYFAGAGRNAPAQQWPDARETAQPWAEITDVGQLERAFWLCDYVATTRGVDATPVALCTAAYDDLKNVKFAGDFHALLDWWQSNKPEAHRRLSAAELRPTID